MATTTRVAMVMRRCRTSEVMQAAFDFKAIQPNDHASIKKVSPHIARFHNRQTNQSQN
jgi:hypothetical protein